MSVSFLNRFDIEIEPLFACIALYDIKERKKASVHYSINKEWSCSFIHIFSSISLWCENSRMFSFSLFLLFN